MQRVCMCVTLETDAEFPVWKAHAGMEGPRGTAYSAGQQQQPCQGPPDELSAARKLLISVPYSLHCNFEELSSFVRAIAPRDIQVAR